MTYRKSKTADASSLGDLKIGVSLFDTEHAQLASLASRFCEECRTSANGAYLQGRFELVVKKIRAHFVHEEEYMHHSGYPKAKAHCEDHARLMALLQQLQTTADFTSMDRTIVPLLQQFCGETLPKHIVDHDELFGSYLNSKGIR